MHFDVRPPLITIPLAELKVGMRVQNESGTQGTITNINHTDVYPITVQYDGNSIEYTYLTTGYKFIVDDAICIDDDGSYGIRLVQPPHVSQNMKELYKFLYLKMGW
jgi:hypothetical protein